MMKSSASGLIDQHATLCKCGQRDISITRRRFAQSFRLSNLHENWRARTQKIVYSEKVARRAQMRHGGAMLKSQLFKISVRTVLRCEVSVHACLCSTVHMRAAACRYCCCCCCCSLVYDVCRTRCFLWRTFWCNARVRSPRSHVPKSTTRRASKPRGARARAMAHAQKMMCL